MTSSSGLELSGYSPDSGSAVSSMSSGTIAAATGMAISADGNTAVISGTNGSGEGYLGIANLGSTSTAITAVDLGQAQPSNGMPNDVTVSPNDKFAYVGDPAYLVGDLLQVNLSTDSITSNSNYAVKFLSMCPDGTLFGFGYDNFGSGYYFAYSGASSGQLSTVFTQASSTPTGIYCGTGGIYMDFSGSIDSVNATSGALTTVGNVPGSLLQSTTSEEIVGAPGAIFTLNSSTVNLVEGGNGSAIYTDSASNLTAGAGDGWALASPGSLIINSHSVKYPPSGTYQVAVGYGRVATPAQFLEQQLKGDAENSLMMCTGCIKSLVRGISDLVKTAFKGSSAELETEVGDAEMTEVLPVNTATGNFSYGLPSIGLSGLGPPLSISPTYNSLYPQPTGPVNLGPGMTDGLLMNIALNTPATGDVTITEPNGSQTVFYPQQTGGNCATGYQALDTSSVLDSGGTYYCALGNVNGAFYSNSNGTDTLISFFPYQVATFCVVSAGCTSGSLSYTKNELMSYADQFGNTTTINWAQTAGSGTCPSTASSCVTASAPSGRSLSLARCMSTSCTVTTNSYVNGEVESATDGVHNEVFIYASSGSPCATSLPATCTAGDLLSASLSATSDSTNRTWSFSYDELNGLNAVNKVTDPNKNAELTNTYDDAATSDVNFGVVSTQTNALGNTTNFAYSMNWSTVSGVTEVTDPMGYKSLDIYANGLVVNQIKGWTSSMPQVWSFLRDPASGLIYKTIDPNGHTFTFSYDAFGRLLGFNDQVRGNTNATTFTYSSTLNPSYFEPTATIPPAQGSDASGSFEITHQYGSDGQLTQTQVNGDYGGGSNPQPTTNFNWCEQSTCTGGYVDGELESVESPTTGYTVLGYDPAGDVTSSKDPDGNLTSATYDTLGRIDSITTPNGNASGYGTAAANTVIYASTTNPYTTFDTPTLVTGMQLSNTSATTAYTYDAIGNLLTTTTVTGSSLDSSTNTPDPTIYTTNAYDAADELCWTSKEQSSNGCSSPPYGAETTTYAYDSDGNLCWETEGAFANRTSAYCSSPPSSQTTHYGYNALSQTTEMDLPSGAITRYAYDLAGNMLAAVTQPASGDSFANLYAYDASNSLTSSAVDVPANSGSSSVLTTLSSISCGSGSDCWGLGLSTTNSPMVIGNPSGNSGGYTTQTPATVTSLSGISCTTAAICVSIGMDGSNPVVMYTTNSGTTWSTNSLSGATSLSAISCYYASSTDTCYVTGENSTTTVVLETTNYGSTWTTVSGGSSNSPTWPISSITCSSTTFCIVAGTSSGAGVMDSYTQSNSPSFATLTVPTGVTSLSSISCTFSTDCVGVGEAGTSAAIITSTNAVNFTSITVPTGVTSLSSVSCDNFWSFTNCEATGSSSTSPAIVQISYGNSTFTASSQTVPPGLSAVTSASCSGAPTCAISANASAGAGDVLTSENANSSSATWSPQFNLTTNTYDSAGAIWKATDSLGTVTYNYDAISRLVAAEDDLGHYTTYAYDLDSNITCVGYDVASLTSGCSGTPGPGNTIVSYSYDTANRMQSLTTFAGKPTGASGCSSITSDKTSFSYDPNGDLTTETLPLCQGSSVADTFVKSYFPDSALSTLQLNVAAGQANFSESRNGAGMLTEDYGGYYYGYDAQGRTAYSSQSALGTSTPATFTYDTAGNLLTSPDSSYTQCYNSSAELIYRYVPGNGNSCTSGGYQVSYDGYGNRTSLQFPWGSPQQTEVKTWSDTTLNQTNGYCIFDTCYNLYYAGSGRLMQEFNGTTLKAAMTWNELTNQIISDNTWDYVYGPGGSPIEAMQVEPNSGRSQNYLLTTDNNSVVATINNSGTLTCTTYHGAFGTGNVGTSCPQLGYDGAWMFQGYLTYFDNRFYDSETGNFLNPDPSVSLAGQPYAFAGDGAAMGSPNQPYTFANNNSGNIADPSGLCPANELMDLGKSLSAAGARDLEDSAAKDAVEEGERDAMAGSRAAGNAGEQAAGIVKNTTHIKIPGDVRGYRIPDELNDSVIGEVKNVSSLSYTSQLRAYSAFAQSKNLTFNLYVRGSTMLSGPLQETIDSGVINLIRNLP